MYIVIPFSYLNGISFFYKDVRIHSLADKSYAYLPPLFSVVYGRPAE